MTYNGYTNWETWVVELHYDDTFYNMAKTYVETGLTYQEFQDDLEGFIHSTVNEELKYPDDTNLANEFVRMALQTVDYTQLANNAWEQAEKDLTEE